MFRSRRRTVVYPQAEHARVAGSIASAWGNDVFARPALPFGSFVTGVALHDRGYGELDGVEIGAVSVDRWLEIQRRGFAPSGVDAVVDLVVALHVHRLVAGSDEPTEVVAATEMATELPALHRAVGASEGEARAADAIVHLCDAVSFDLCFEEPAERRIEVVGAYGNLVEVACSVDGFGRVAMAPWPFGSATVEGTLAGFEAAGYPHRLVPVASAFRIDPA